MTMRALPLILLLFLMLRTLPKITSAKQKEIGLLTVATVNRVVSRSTAT